MADEGQEKNIDQRYVYDTPEFAEYLSATKAAYWSLAATPVRFTATAEEQLGMFALDMARLAACCRFADIPEETKNYYERRHTEWLRRAADHIAISKAYS